MSRKPSAVPDLTGDQALAISQAGWSLLHFLGEQSQQGANVSLAECLTRAEKHLKSKVAQGVNVQSYGLQLQFLQLFRDEEGFNPFDSHATITKVASSCAKKATPTKRKNPPSDTEEEEEDYDEDDDKKKPHTRVQAAKTKWDTETLPRNYKIDSKVKVAASHWNEFLGKLDEANLRSEITGLTPNVLKSQRLIQFKSWFGGKAKFAKAQEDSNYFIYVELLRKYKLTYGLSDPDFDYVVSYKFAEKGRNFKTVRGNLTEFRETLLKLKNLDVRSNNPEYAKNKKSYITAN